MKNNFLFFIIFLYGCLVVNAQDLVVESASTKDTIHSIHGVVMYNADSVLKKHPTSENILADKKFKTGFQNKYKGNDFNYEELKPRESFWSKLKRKIDDFIRSVFGTIDSDRTANYTDIALRIIGIIVLGFVLYFIIKTLADKEGNWIFGKKNKKTIIKDEDLHENIHEINFPQSILHFENQKDYRSAIRYQFLYVLKRLSDKKLLNWNPEKTNKDYIAELNSTNFSKDFKHLAYIFDYVWYGEFNIDEKQYQGFKNQFQNAHF